MSKQNSRSQSFSSGSKYFGMVTNPVAAALIALGGLSGCVWEVAAQEEIGADIFAGAEKSIVGGAAAAIASNPWQVSLQSDGFSFCGGSVIGDRWILTAQHCVEGVRPVDLRVVAGVTQLSRAGAGDTHEVSQIIRFPGYTSPEFGKDVALLKLSQPLVFGANVQPIALAVVNDNATPAGATATVSGWGTLQSGGSSTPDGLKSVTVPIVANSSAQASYGETITGDQLSAGAGGRDSCQGDSGGPLSVVASRGRVLVGVVSWGYGCGDAEYPGLYARVSSFAGWIRDTTGIAIAGGTPTTPTTPTTLLNQSLSGAVRSFTHFALTVPAGTAVLDVRLSGNSGDADLYVRRGAQPTEATWDCRPYTDASNESCTLAGPAGGTWYVSVAGYKAFSAAQLVVTAR